MKNNGPFWRSNLSNKTFELYKIMTLALFGIVNLIGLVYLNKIDILLSVMYTWVLSITVLYVMSVVYDMINLRHIGLKIITRNFKLNTVINGLLIALFTTDKFNVTILLGALVSGYVITKVYEHFKLNAMFNFALTTIGSLYLLSWMIIGNVNPVIFSFEKIILIQLILLMIYMTIFFTFRIIKKKLLFNTVMLFGVFAIGYILVTDISNAKELLLWLTKSGAVLFYTYLILDNEYSPTNSLALFLYSLVSVIGLAVSLIFELPFVLILSLILVITRIIRDKMDLWGLKSNK